MDLICVVPNPYYAYSAYELTPSENLVKIVNLPEKCTISIYTLNGKLIRKFDKNEASTIQEWNLKNMYDTSIGSGLYIIHVNAPGIGEKIIKWFGAMRPYDKGVY